MKSSLSKPWLATKWILLKRGWIKSKDHASRFIFRRSAMQARSRVASRSLCPLPWYWRASGHDGWYRVDGLHPRAVATWMASFTLSCSCRGLDRGLPSTYSRTRESFPMSWIWQIFGWFSAAMDRASCVKRSLCCSFIFLIPQYDPGGRPSPCRPNPCHRNIFWEDLVWAELFPNHYNISLWSKQKFKCETQSIIGGCSKRQKWNSSY